MIEASFGTGGGVSIGGAYQYDTGQRIRMHGLPSPAALSRMDDFLSGDIVTVQAQYAYVGDSQSEPRLALYDEESGCWTAEVPDAYLTTSDAVHVYVYVMYGADAEHSRSKTMYEGRFTPIARSAPSTNVTPDQINAWDSLVAEVNLTLSTMNTATSAANAAAALAVEAKDGANAAAQAAGNAANAAATATAGAEKWAKATVSVTTLSPGSDATVSAGDNAQGGKHLTLGIPKGEKGDKGDTGPAGVTFRLEGTTLYINTYA